MTFGKEGLVWKEGIVWKEEHAINPFLIKTLSIFLKERYVDLSKLYNPYKMDRFEALIDRVYTNNTTRNDYVC